MTTKKPIHTRDAEASKERLLEAARVKFSHCSYEGVGVRELAAEAGLDPALVIRYFGSKEGLFRQVVATAFSPLELLADGGNGIPGRATDLLAGEFDDAAWREGFDPLRLLLASIGSPTAGPILAAQLEKDFVQPVSDAVGGADARERGVLLAAQIAGLALMRSVVESGGGTPVDRAVLARLLRQSMAVVVG